MRSCNSCTRAPPVATPQPPPADPTGQFPPAPGLPPRPALPPRPPHALPRPVSRPWPAAGVPASVCEWRLQCGRPRADGRGCHVAGGTPRGPGPCSRRWGVRAVWVGPPGPPSLEPLSLSPPAGPGGRRWGRRSRKAVAAVAAEGVCFIMLAILSKVKFNGRGGGATTPTKSLLRPEPPGRYWCRC